MSVAGTLITRSYMDFKGVDFSNKIVAINRSPDALNMWKNYKQTLGKCVETRPDIELLATYGNTVYGLFFYKVGNVTHKIIHCGTELIDEVGDTKNVIYTGMNPRKSNFFVYNQTLYIQDGLQYLEYDGETCQDVVGYIPTTSISRNPAGGGAMYEDVNLLTGIRKNSFSADGTSTDYHLDSQNLDTDFSLIVLVNDTLVTNYTVDTTRGVVTFATAPEKPNTDGADNVVITFKKTIAGYRDRIEKCTLLTVFDNRVFYSGHKDYPNTIFHCSLNNPRYISDTDYYNEGMDLSPVRSMVTGNNALWVFKEPSQANTTVFYHNPVLEGDNKIYPSVHSSIATGCIGGAINFNDDIIFFSDRGMEGISADVTSEQVISHRSSLVDNKLLNEANYKDMILEEYEGYLLAIIGNKVYLADSRQKVQIDEHLEYEWYYWELSKEITCTLVKDGVLYLGTKDGLYTLTKTATEIESYWTTPEDSFEYPHYAKTTNKKGFVMDITGAAVKLQAKTDNEMFMTVDTYLNTKGYVVAKLKKKKWKTIQLKLTSTTPFGLYLVTLESYVGGYIKR